MRRYRIDISGPNVPVTKPSKTWDSQINGQDNPSAQDIAFDISTGPLSTTFAGSYIEVFGISLQEVTKVRQWQGGTLSLYGGFSSGFPLANAKQYGLLARARIQQAYGNWTGTQQSAIFILLPADDNTIVFFWKAGTVLSAAITSSLKTAYPGYVVKSHLLDDPVANEDDMHCCPNIYTLRDYIKQKTKLMRLAPSLGGIDLCLDNTGSIINIYDGPIVSKPVKIDFNDFQGQPVYFGPSDNTAAVQTALNLRYDLAMGGQFIFPTQVATGYVLITPASSTAPLAKDNSALSGTFSITTLRHIGRFRDPHGESWVTVAEGNPLG